MRFWSSWWKRFKGSVPQTIYYVAGDGNDSHDGRHPLRAWCTIERLNQHKHGIRKDDQILFKRGFIYPGRPYYIGAEKHFALRVGAYGSGKHPVFPDVEKPI